ncbi:hypothetical protein OG935_25350 [Nocardia cyriacigeorgica]|uniref:hypothetical protein n=1 Tax=Nocardia cyriacigeorgica TaxID=135487 RepID=UPI0018954F13|nr:hypothetical protein [Nocardia cyriacigeorgica]MBF6321559.1 hypothetical protein [Nocardia cyriacigeorgica]MBF6494763.1 hypothetical protein [Nocardia cyriacigeorgica]
MSPHDAINAANAAAARAAGWPELTGSPAQIGWAETIRVGKMGEFETAHAQTPEPDRSFFREAMLRETQASEWIGGRPFPWQAMLVHGLIHDELDALLAKSRQRTAADSAQHAA